MSETRSGVVYLASQSPRRRELLRQIGIECELLPATVDETPALGETADDLACRLALAKARAGVAVAERTDRPVLAADTVVALGREIFGKPADEADALRMLARLSGRVHTVFTAVAVACGHRERVALSRTEVALRPISAEEARAYWCTGEPADKAGAYGIQGLGAVFVQEIRGSYSGVMGLPLFETARLLTGFGVPILAVEAPATAGARP